MFSKHARPLAGERNLPDRRGRLAVFELESPLGQIGDGATKRNRARRYDNHACAALMQGRNVRSKRIQPHAPNGAKLPPVDQER